MSTAKTLRNRLASIIRTKKNTPKGYEHKQHETYDHVNNSGGNPMFSHLKHASIYGGNFVQNNAVKNDRPAFNILQKGVATSAFHNSAQRVDPPRCHPNTRVAIQQQILDWILLDSSTRETWIMWLHGAAGAGKSAIMQSIAELCGNEGIPLASFFFFRTDPTRNTMTPLIATLVYQLIQNIPQAQDEIFAIIDKDPLIFRQSVESQFQRLIIQPLVRLREHIRGFFVVLIDGLDECTDRAQQANLIRLLGNVSRSRTIPVVFLVASRREPQIEAAFIHHQVSDYAQIIALDNSDIEQTSDDIRRFLIDKCKEIKETHLRRQLLPSNWPPGSAIEEIVTKSSGQFIYAAVVINYILSPRANPAHRLEIIRGIRLRDLSSQNPFAHLDALYQYIFSQVEALDKVFDMLAYILMAPSYYIAPTEYVLLLAPGELEIYFADLTSVIQCDPRDNWGPMLRFLHASLPDFLLDESRSGDYHIDPIRYQLKLLCQFLERPLPMLDPLLSIWELGVVSYQETWRLDAISTLLKKAATSDRLQRALKAFNFNFANVNIGSDLTMICIDILRDLNTMNFDGQGQVYRHFLDVFGEGYAKHWPLLSDDIREQIRSGCSDLLDRIMDSNSASESRPQ